jgi:hypothetical protein
MRGRYEQWRERSATQVDGAARRRVIPAQETM